VLDKSHIFVGYDILQIGSKEEAEMVLEELKGKLKEEPEMPVFEDYEGVVKSVIKKDYSILSMFMKSSTILQENGDVETFRESIVAKTVTLGVDKVAEIFKENLKRRYDINLSFICRPRKYITIVDKEDNSNVREAMKKIESVYAELFCEDIVDPERTIWEQDLKKESTPNEQEQAILNMIEHAVFNGEDGELFLSEIWRKLDLLNVNRGWKILDLVKKCPEKFTIGNKSNDSGITEFYIEYTSPVKEVAVVEEETQEEQHTESKPVVKEGEHQVEGDTIEVYVGFSNREDIRMFCGEELNHREVCKYHEDYVCKVILDKNNKKAVLGFLKLYYASMKTQEITIIYEGSSRLAKELEDLLMN
jgi:hypothetical protein